MRRVTHAPEPVCVSILIVLPETDEDHPTLVLVNWCFNSLGWGKYEVPEKAETELFRQKTTLYDTNYLFITV